MGSNMQKLGNILVERMKKTSAAAVRITTELGTINDNLSLTTDSLPVSIPKGDYMVNIMLTGVDHNTFFMPSTFRGLQPNDRVLVVWCGYEPVVVAIVTTS